MKLAESGGKVSHTSLIFRGETTSFGFSATSSANTCAERLAFMERPVFDGVRGDARFAAVKEKLSAHAGEWNMDI